MKAFSLTVSSLSRLLGALVLLEPPFCILVGCKQRTVRGANVGTASAVNALANAGVDKSCFTLFFVLYLHSIFNGADVDINGALFHTFAAADAGGGLGESCSLFVECEDAVGYLNDGGVNGNGCVTVHRTADNNLANLFKVGLGELKKGTDGGTDGSDEVAGLLNCGTVNGYDTLDKGHTGVEVFRHLREGRNVDDECTEGGETLARDGNSAGRIVKHNLLCTLGIDRIELVDNHVGLVCKLPLEHLDRIGLVFLDTDLKGRIIGKILKIFCRFVS